MKLQFLWLALVVVTAFIYQRDSGLRYGHREMCIRLQNDFVEQLTSEEFDQCLNLYEKALTFEEWERKTNSWLGQWGWSHLSVYSPKESTEIWESKTKNIGVKLKTIDDKILVYRAHSKSKFERGDIFIEVNGRIPLYQSDVTNSEGLFKIRRGKKIIEITARSGDYFWNDKVEISKNIVKIPSFRGEFFEDEALEDISRKISQIKEEAIYLDLRNNIGGNIASALRLMSLFLCDGAVLGSFKIPSREGLGISDYPLTVDQSIQVAHMKSYYEVKLRVPKNKFCSRKNVSVLVNRRTASTAELVAQAFIDFERGSVIGEKTSGRMVLSSWDQIVFFPQGFYFSHPYALYISKSGSPIESVGVIPDVFKTYILKTEAKGQDSFLD